MATVRITINGLDAFVRSPYAAKDVIRDMPDRQWNAALKVWVIPTTDVPQLTRDLEAAGFAVLVADDTEKKSQNDTAELERLRAENALLQTQLRQAQASKGGPSPYARRGGATTWADDLLAAVGPTLADKAYKALSRVCHPDVGGSTEVMQLLNVAHDKARKAA